MSGEAGCGLTNKKMTKGIIYYTGNNIGAPIFLLVQEYILKAGLPIVSCSLKPIEFGQNIVIKGERSYPTMVKQILTALENSTAKYVFFTEHDCLYPKSHFDFTPSEDDVFYYNEHVYRWWFEGDTAIRHDRMLPLSCLCVNRKFALEHYRMRQRKIEEWGLDHFRSREPRLARIWGYEPGTKKRRRGGLTDDDFDTWYSKDPVIDIRYWGTFSSPKIHLSDFKHQPTGWQERNIKDIPGWDLMSIFPIETRQSFKKLRGGYIK